MRVFVLNMRGEPLMPCTQRKARILLRDGKAVIEQYNPFTIRLTYATGETKQPCSIGVDTGSKHVGIAVTSEDKVLCKAEIELRQDIKSKIDILDKTTRKGHITGFTTGGAYAKDADGEYITIPGKRYKQITISKLRLICHNNNWQYIACAE